MKPPKSNIVPLRGGLDQQTTVILRPPGSASELLNFEPELSGGYRRINGYERVDGHPSPLTAVYYTVVVADSSGISVGDTLAGGDSSATSTVVIKDDVTNTLGITRLVGNYMAGEPANGTTIVEAELLNGIDDNETSNAWQLAAEDLLRDDIQPIPGSGDALYAFRYDGAYYAFRESGGNVALYESTSSGWASVGLYHILFFDGGVLTEAIAEGTTINGETSSATAEVKRFVKNGGTYSSDASGYMVIDVTSGTFQDNENIRESTTVLAVADGANAAITLSTGGVFRHTMHNFYATSDTQRVYGCDGVNPAWEFDGDVLCPIYFPAPDEDPSWNAPAYVEAHKAHLFLAYAEGTVAHSSPGEPLVFSGLLGAAEFGLGDTPSGMASRGGNVLALYTRNKTYGLYGTSVDDWELRLISETSGAIDGTVAVAGSVYGLDDRGIAPLDRVDRYGDFESATVSRAVQGLIDEKKDSIVGVSISREKNQYRLHASDGDVIVMVFDGYIDSPYPAFSLLRFPISPTFVSYSEDDGDEYTLFGDDSGYVYRMDTGYNFDGDIITYALRSQYLHQGSPSTRKSYHKLYVDMTAESSFSIRVAFDLSYGSHFSAQNTTQSRSVVGGGGDYDVDNWDEIFWDANTYSSGGVRLSGSGTNIGILLLGESNTTQPFTIETLDIHYLPRRIQRSE